MKTQYCIKCNIEKNIIEFHTRVRRVVKFIYINHVKDVKKSEKTTRV